VGMVPRGERGQQATGQGEGLRQEEMGKARYGLLKKREGKKKRLVHNKKGVQRVRRMPFIGGGGCPYGMEGDSVLFLSILNSNSEKKKGKMKLRKAGGRDSNTPAPDW